MDKEPTSRSGSGADWSPPTWLGEPHGELQRDELKRRASAGLFIVGTRGVVILLLGFSSNVVIARLLTPEDFGVVAIGASFVLLTGVLSDGGLGGALIRRPEPPSSEELQALTALQLTVSAGLALTVVTVAAPFGKIGWVTALMVSSMLLVAFQFPGRILFERSLRYGPLAVVELSQVVTYHLSAIALVVAGFGVWGLASATVARAAVGTVVMARLSPAGFVRPRFAWHLVRPLMRFGLRFQAVSVTLLVRDQGLNLATAAIASVSTLGLLSLARRLMEVPYMFFASLGRISMPAMSHVVASKEDAGPLMERAAGMAAIGAGLVLTGLAGSAPGLIPGLFGEQWRGASSIIPGACLGLGISGSVSITIQSYLYAKGDASAVVQAAIFQAMTLFAVSLPLLPVIGVSALGLGWFVSSVMEAFVLSRAAQKWTPVRMTRPLLAPVVIGVVAGLLGWLVSAVGGDLVSGVAGGICSVLLFQAGLLVFRRQLCFDTARFFLRSMRAASGR